LPAVIWGSLIACSDGGSRNADGAPVDPLEPRVEIYDGFPTDAPDEYDQIRVIEVGDPAANNVLVLSPGTSAGAAYFLPLAVDLVKALPAWQVWSVDRRENLLEDHSKADAFKAGRVTHDEAWDYYIGWLVDGTVTSHIEPPASNEVAFARGWGMEVAVEDLHVVIDKALALGGEVVLGGHSLGGNITVADAAWDFGGMAGGDDLSGLVLIDGGSGPASDMAEVQASLNQLATGSPFNDLLGLGLPWAPGVFNLLGSTAALLEPDQPSPIFDSPLIPPGLKPPVQPTNRAQFGYALDVDTSLASLALVHLSLGTLAPAGEPRGWVDDGIVPIDRAATMFSGIDGIDGTAWYHPLRLTIDGRTTNAGLPHPSQELTGVRAIHGDELDMPIFALETSFGAGRVLAGAQRLGQQSGIPENKLTLVEAHQLTHTDPMAVEPDNPLVESLTGFLGDIAG